MLSRMGVTVDVTPPDGELGRYGSLVAPKLHVCAPATARRLEDYVSTGGTLVLGPRRGVKDAANSVAGDPLPGELRRLAGCAVKDYDAFSAIPDRAVRLRDDENAEFEGHGIAEVLSPEGAGRCIYMGTVAEEAWLDKLSLGIFPPEVRPSGTPLPASVEPVRRRKGADRFAFYLNHSEVPVTVEPQAGGVGMLDGAAVAGTLRLDTFGVAVVRERA